MRPAAPDLHRGIGNQAAARLLQRRAAAGRPATGAAGVQTRLRVTHPGDVYEQQADRVAAQVLAQATHPGVRSAPGIQRYSGEARAQIGAAPASVDRVLAQPGTPLDPALRHDMEQRFGQEFSRVRLHTDVAAEQSARDLDAHAYTVGHDIVFGASQFAPATQSGRRLFAHELAHVVQQTRESNDLQTKLIQRDGPHDPGDMAQEEKEALANFKNDWGNNFSHYDNLIKFSKTSYDKDQKEGIKAEITGKLTSITLGKPYSTETDEKIRWLWIKTEVIDKNVKVDRFEDIAYDPTHSKINEINPPYAVGKYCQLNCPATAAALDHYLRTGKVSPAICHPLDEITEGYGFDISKNNFSESVNWKQASKTIKNKLKKHGNFVIVEATRSEKQMNDNHLAQNHYFSVVNVKGHLFAIDASEDGIVSDDIQNYIDNNVIATTYRIVKGEFTVTEIIPNK
jgi:hypothetical protein